jgi:hypothetical protein
MNESIDELIDFTPTSSGVISAPLEEQYESEKKVFDNSNGKEDEEIEDITKDSDTGFVTSKDIQFVLDTLSKQAPHDKTQTRQIFYGICSSQTSTKIHHNVNSRKSGEGKSYLLKIVSDLFPDSFILKFNNMSDKALYHQEGFEAVKNEDTGKYEELKPILKELEREIAELEEKKEEEDAKGQQQKDKLLIKSYKNQIKDIEEEIKYFKSIIASRKKTEGLFILIRTLLMKRSKKQ